MKNKKKLKMKKKMKMKMKMKMKKINKIFNLHSKSFNAVESITYLHLN